MALRDRLRDVAGETQRAVDQLFARWQGGGLSRDEFVAGVAAAIARANQRATTVADRAMAVQLARTLGRDIEPQPTELPELQPRLRKSVASVLDENPEVATTAAVLAESQRKRLGRLARSEPLGYAQRSIQGHLDREGAGWERATGPDPCPLCTELDDGVVRPASVDMARHPNCSCVQRPARL